MSLILSAETSLQTHCYKTSLHPVIDLKQCTGSKVHTEPDKLSFYFCLLAILTYNFMREDEHQMVPHSKLKRQRLIFKEKKLQTLVTVMVAHIKDIKDVCFLLN